MNLNIAFNTKHRTDDVKKRISETMKRTGELWKRYLELKPEGYDFKNCKQFRSYLKNTHDEYLIDLLS